MKKLKASQLHDIDSLFSSTLQASPSSFDSFSSFLNNKSSSVLKPVSHDSLIIGQLSDLNISEPLTSLSDDKTQAEDKPPVEAKIDEPDKDIQIFPIDATKVFLPNKVNVEFYGDRLKAVESSNDIFEIYTAFDTKNSAGPLPTVIEDFESGKNFIALSNVIVGEQKQGDQLDFYTGFKLQDSDFTKTGIYYDTLNGNLYFKSQTDWNGDAGHVALLVTLQDAPTLAITDLFIRIPYADVIFESNQDFDNILKNGDVFNFEYSNILTIGDSDTGGSKNIDLIENFDSGIDHVVFNFDDFCMGREMDFEFQKGVNLNEAHFSDEYSGIPKAKVFYNTDSGELFVNGLKMTQFVGAPDIQETDILFHNTFVDPYLYDGGSVTCYV